MRNYNIKKSQKTGIFIAQSGIKFYEIEHPSWNFIPAERFLTASDATKSSHQIKSQTYVILSDILRNEEHVEVLIWQLLYR